MTPTHTTKRTRMQVSRTLWSSFAKRNSCVPKGSVHHPICSMLRWCKHETQKTLGRCSLVYPAKKALRLFGWLWRLPKALDELDILRGTQRSNLISAKAEGLTGPYRPKPKACRYPYPDMKLGGTLGACWNPLVEQCFLIFAPWF